MKKYTLELIVFLSGATVMILEIVGSRVLAPYVGTSTFVWTSIIGIILGSLSLGYWLGGKIADKNPSFKTLSEILFIGAMLIALIGLFKEDVLVLLQQNIGSIKLNSIVSSFILFTLPSVVLGMVSPYAVRLKMKSVTSSGRTVGNLYALSTIGSIVGTFLAGFYLLAILGNTKILFLLTIVLLAASAISFAKNFTKGKVVLALLIVSYTVFGNFQTLNLAVGEVIDIDSDYNRIWIYEDKDYYTNSPIRNLQINSNNSSSMFIEDEKKNELVYPYTKFYRLAEHFAPNLETGLMIGGAAYSYPKDFLLNFPEATLDVVEIDPALTEIAKEHFELEENERLNIYHEDGRIFLNNSEKKYDVIFGDAFSGGYSIPYHLTTIEAVQKIYDALNENGVALVNIISSIEGENGKFFRAEYYTYKEIFPQVYLFPVHYTKNTENLQNIMLIALKSAEIPKFTNSNAELQGYLENLYTEKVTNDLPILTDEFAPVDQYVMPMLK
ncbi:fused MFS/spermidine synthase [Candidatus Peregrinibacteria bacterium]|jgi:spermidine synthase|nr:fused MFS/spermidine synthase [Candidatus Peregrinibacteria bacterium]MBT7737038.1 fused MFS/spermidine synthase [Candidatus Peregrinibacteria bacterium]